MRQHFNWDLLACWDVIELIADSVEVQSSSIWKLFSWTEVHLLQISTAFHVWKYDFKLFKMVSFLEDLDSTSWPNAGFWIAVSTLGKVNEIDTEFSCQGRYCLFSYQSLHRRLTHKIYLIFSDKWVYTWLLIKQFGYQALPVGLWSQLLSDVTQARAKTNNCDVFLFIYFNSYGRVVCIFFLPVNID